MCQISCYNFKNQRVPKNIYSGFISVRTTSSYTSVCQCVTWAYKCQLLVHRVPILFPFFPLCYPQHYGLRAVLLLTFYLAIFRPFSPSSARFLPFLEFDITQRFHSLQCIQLWIYSEFFIQEQKEGYGGTPILYGEAIWPPFMPPQAAECCSNKSPDVLLFFFFLFLWILFTSYCFFFSPAWKCSFAAGRALTACLSLNSLRALGLSQTPFFFPPPPFFCLPLFTLVMSRLLPLSRLQHRNPWREVGQEGA